MNQIQRLRPDGLINSPAFSHTAVVPPGATTIYVGGQNAVDAEGSLVGPGDPAVQAVRALANAKIALEAAGAPSLMSSRGRCCSSTAPIREPPTPQSPPISRRPSHPWSPAPW